MAERSTAQTWTGRAVFAGLCLAVIFAQLLPLDMRPDRWAAPDILLAVTLAWVTRRPDYAPVLLIAVLLLLADLLFQRPPGLWAALVLMASEGLRRRSLKLRSVSLVAEWGTVAMMIVGVTLGYRIVLGIVVTAQPPLGLTLIQMIMTILIYPLVVLVAQWIFGVGRPLPGETDSLGQRL